MSLAENNPNPAPQSPDGAAEGSESGHQLRSVHTSSVPEILHRLKSSLLVTTYQAGKVILLRNQNGVLNTHFRSFSQPMGLAVDGGRLAIGCSYDIWEFQNIPAVAQKIEPAGSHDSAFLPRNCHVTGDVRIHEMAWVSQNPNERPELWFVNTAFSCLSVRSSENSFEPVWKPKFISQLQPGDQCHLNGLAVRDGRVRYVTALGTTDTEGGWRENKRDGGVLIDVESNEVISRKLSMPHSPRWYRDQLWILHSGTGGFGRIDLQTGKYEEITRLPGFTRGLTFAGNLALIGLSQVRESATFSGIPICDELTERTCGVWVVDIETGATVGFVRFEDAVQEIFAVELLSGMIRPDLVTDDKELISRSYVLSDGALEQVSPEFRQVEAPG
ncbi:TIGR03032 family protein [Thalassoglobus sp. JC818]|uniref:TIGR03032 family protein n=1 Tax=Thalassoglobus sp. JC818 TaxID=3232136 RepID=UPI00345987C9